MKMKNVYFLYIFNFLKNVQFFGAVAVPFFLYRAQLDYVRMFTLEAVFSVSMMLMEIPTGIVADRWGRRTSLMLGSVTLGAGFFCIALTQSFALLALAEVVAAAGLTLITGADRALLYECVRDAGKEEQSEKIFARYDAAGTTALLISFPLGTLFVGSGLVPYTTALAMVFAVTGIGIATAALAVLPVTERARVHHGESFLRDGIDGFLFIFRHAKLRGFSINYAVISSLTFFMFWMYQSLLIENNVMVSWYGFIASGFNAAAMLLLALTGPIKKRFGVRWTLFLTSFIPGLLYIGAGVFPGILTAFVAIFGVTSLRLFRSPFLNALMNRQIADTSRATVLSGISMLERVLTAMLYPVVGILTDRSLNLTLVFLGVLTVSGSFFLRIRDHD